MSNPHVKRIRGYLRRAILLNYLARLASVLLFLAFLFYLGVYVGGKWAFYDPPYGHAVTLYHAGHLLIALLFSIFWGWPKLRRPETQSSVALRLEKADLTLNDCLTSALNFSAPDPLMEECLQVSVGILPGFYDDTVRRIHSKRRWTSVTPWYFWVWLALSLGLFLFWNNMARFEPFTSSDAWRLYQENFWVDPYRPLHHLIVQPEWDTVLKGDSVHVQAMLTGPGEHQGTLLYSMKGFPQEKAEMKTKALGSNVFEFDFENLQSDLVYQIETGPLTSPQYEIKVEIPPELTSIQLVYHYPEFMKRKTEVLPPGQGAVTAPVGTTVELTTQWSRPMSKVFFSINSGEEKPMDKLGSLWKTRFPVNTVGRYILSGSSVEGVPIRVGLEFPIESEADLQPEIEWVWPKEDIDFSGKVPSKKLALSYRVSDDHGITSVFLHAGAPGRATKTYEIANLDGKSREYRGHYKFDLRPWNKSPVVRVRLMASDNHPHIPNQTPTQVRRFYLQPPGSFSEEENPEDELVEADPYEQTALELLSLIKAQKSQNAKLNDETKPSESEVEKWLGAEELLIRHTARVGLRSTERARQVRYGEISSEAPQSEKPPAELAEKDKQVIAKRSTELPARLEQVAARLIGSATRLDQLVPGNLTDQNAAADHQLRQYDRGRNGSRKRSQEEGVRARAQLEAAFKELTDQEVPRSSDEMAEEIAEAEKAAEETEGEPGEGPEDDSEQGDKPPASKEDPEFAYENEEKKEEEEENDVTVLANKPLDGEGEAGVGDSGAGSSATLPTNVYAASTFTLDPDSVNIETPSTQLLYKTLEDNLSDMDLTQYGNVASPPEYGPAVENYNRVLLGE
jgi:hypothetical protein